VGAIFSAPVQTGLGAHPASCAMGTGSFPRVESGGGVTLTHHPLLVPRSKIRVELYLYSPYGPSWSMKRVKPTKYTRHIRDITFIHLLIKSIFIADFIYSHNTDGLDYNDKMILAHFIINRTILIF
jgi:hypothetical protein